MTTLKKHNVEVDAEFLRDIFFNYLNNARYKRERILFSNTLKNIKEAIKQNKKISLIKYLQMDFPM